MFSIEKNVKFIGGDMRKGVVYLLVVLITGCASGKYCYTDLCDVEPPCSQRVYPGKHNQDCISGVFKTFSIEKVTDFGVKPAWSPDGGKLVFLDKVYGDAYEKNLDTGEVRCLTCEYEHNGFFEVHYLKDGDYLLLGPENKNFDLRDRLFRNGFYWMPADLSRAPMWMGEEHYEGAAVSRTSRKIAYAKTWADSLFKFPSTVYIAEVTREGKIINRTAVHKSPFIIEAHSFLPQDRGLVFSLFTADKEVYTVDFETQEVTNQSNSRSYDQPADIFPDGRFTIVESNRHVKTPYLDALKRIAVPSLEIYMLKLDGTGKDIRRLTHFSDESGDKAYSPMVSPEGCRIAFMRESSSGEWFRFKNKTKGLYLLEFYSCDDENKEQ